MIWSQPNRYNLCEVCGGKQLIGTLLLRENKHWWHIIPRTIKTNFHYYLCASFSGENECSSSAFRSVTKNRPTDTLLNSAARAADIFFCLSLTQVRMTS